MIGDLIERQLKSFAKRVANEGGPLADEIVEAFGDEMKAALRKQFEPRKRDFKVRPSNIGRPVCQLWHEKNGYEKAPFDDTFLIKMLIGDAVEAIIRALLRAAKVNVTSHGDQVEMDVAGVSINGESDVDIAGKVYDIKSASPYSFDKKFSAGYDALKNGDSFGYIAQLQFYSEAQGKSPGGWIAVNKSSGEITVCEAVDSDAERAEAAEKREKTVNYLHSDLPLKRVFKPVENTFNKKPTGEMCLPSGCNFCEYIQHCYPDAEYRHSKMSRAKPTTISGKKWFVPDAD